MTPLSVLDLSPVPEGSDAGQALHNSLDLARHVERLGFKRFWMAEHHNMPGIASAATSVALAHIAAGTDSIVVGAGGVMLPNHAPLVIAEQFGTLAALHPGRVELGLGRAPGTDQITMRAMRRDIQTSGDEFPQDVVELMHYFQEPKPNQAIQAVPGSGLKVPIWILGSSTFGAQLAAILGLPYAFASHFAPAAMTEAAAIYRKQFQPSDQLQEPYIMFGLNVVAADTEDEAQFLFSSVQQSFLNIRRGRPGKLPPPIVDMESQIDPQGRAMLDHSLSCAIVGDSGSVRRGIEAFIDQTAADELIITSSIFDHAARLYSFSILGDIYEVMKETR